MVMKWTSRYTVPLITLVVMAGLLSPLFFDFGFGPTKPGRRVREAADPVSILVARAQIADVPVYIDGVGTARPAASVTVRPQVDGQLQRVLWLLHGVCIESGQEIPRCWAPYFSAHFAL